MNGSGPRGDAEEGRSGSEASSDQSPHEDSDDNDAEESQNLTNDRLRPDEDAEAPLSHPSSSGFVPPTTLSAISSFSGPMAPQAQAFLSHLFQSSLFKQGNQS